MPVFQLSTHVPGPLAEVYAFHTDTRNLARLQPPGFSLARLELPPVIGPGAVISLAVRFLGITQHWKVCLDELTPPHGRPARARVVDRALESPFGFWSHRHVFVEEEGGVEMTDVVDFDPPGGAAGWLLLPGCYLVLYLMFRFRHAATRRIWKAA